MKRHPLLCLTRPAPLSSICFAPRKGPYRESFAEYCAELQSSALPLLIRCPNAVNDVGINREKWLPNPSIGDESTSAELQVEMLGFLGRLMGVAVRSHQPLDLDLPSIVWKQLVRAPITRLVGNFSFVFDRYLCQRYCVLDHRKPGRSYWRLMHAAISGVQVP